MHRALEALDLSRSGGALPTMVRECAGIMRRHYEFISEREGPRSSGLSRAFEVLLLTIIGSPPSGRRVTRRTGQTACPGLKRRSKCFTMVASISVASCRAKVDPMHLRGP